jgi:hypothetical protein
MGHKVTDTSQHPAHGDTSLNFAGPSIDRSAVKAQLTDGVEIEAKFFMPRALAHEVTSALPFVHIEQRYFPRGLINPLLKGFADVLGPRPAGNELRSARNARENELPDFSIARIRRTFRPGEQPHYFIEFKGAKEVTEGARISRREISHPISAKQYKALTETATAGIVRKRRYSISGTITIQGRPISAEAQIDCVQAAGKKLQKINTSFDTVDIELQDPSHIHALRAGRHSFPFLASCIELSSADKKLARPLATKRIAKRGLDPEALQAIKKLEGAAHRLNSKSKN